MKEKAKLEEEKKDEEKEDPKGIPEFWLTVFKNVDLLSDMLQVGSSSWLLVSQTKWVTVRMCFQQCKNQGVLPPAGQVVQSRGWGGYNKVCGTFPVMIKKQTCLFDFSISG